MAAPNGHVLMYALNCTHTSTQCTHIDGWNRRTVADGVAAHRSIWMKNVPTKMCLITHGHGRRRQKLGGCLLYSLHSGKVFCPFLLAVIRRWSWRFDLHACCTRTAKVATIFHRRSEGDIGQPRKHRMPFHERTHGARTHTRHAS